MTKHEYIRELLERDTPVCVELEYANKKHTFTAKRVTAGKHVTNESLVIKDGLIVECYYSDNATRRYLCDYIYCMETMEDYHYLRLYAGCVLTTLHKSSYFVIDSVIHMSKKLMREQMAKIKLTETLDILL